jgi:hypothetical protein
MIDRAKKFCKNHTDEIIILGSFTIVNGCLVYLTTRTVSRGLKVSYLKVDNGDNPAPKDMTVHVVYKNGKHNSFRLAKQVQ